MRLGFSVSAQPPPMRELSPYRHVLAPHLDGYLQVRSGEFLLVPLPGGRTRLEGRTRYELRVFPAAYWSLWSDALIHAIHARVLEHVKAERTPSPPGRLLSWGMLRHGLLVVLLAQVLGASSSARHFDVIAVFEPAKKPGGDGAIAVTFRALDPDVKVNETPAPRLKLDLTQTLLEDRQPPAPASVPDFDPATAHYLDISQPVRFPAALSRTAPSRPSTR